MKKLQFALLLLLAAAGIFTADLGYHLFYSLAAEDAAILAKGAAAPLLSACGMHSEAQFITAFMIAALFCGALIAANIVCAASRAMESKMARDE